MGDLVCDGSLHILCEISAMEADYVAEIGLAAAERVNVDARLILLGLGRLLSKVPASVDPDRTGLVLGAQFGARESYEAFECSLAKGPLQPRSFAHALPSSPAAAASLHFRLRGPLVTLSGSAEIGGAVIRHAELLLERRRCDLCIAGCWQLTSQTAGLPGHAELLLIALRRGAGDRSFDVEPPSDPGIDVSHRPPSCITFMAEWMGGLRKRAPAK